MLRTMVIIVSAAQITVRATVPVPALQGELQTVLTDPAGLADTAMIKADEIRYLTIEAGMQILILAQ
ncbi:MAG: hypothetical protein U5P41_16065 [Gammaproteobacteria bacterium]|nr:hypothetical protein [Gammaproteobacteria bacterium]